ncbi:MAG: ATP-grasp domain-containing protein [Candidatus Bathyarchaeota archaeon]|nr:MAG: ATP-grasp domain-containing protein [Candidatus Bathyarchaeota archaeon]
MIEKDIRNVLVIGLDVVSLASSARKAGYQVHAVDYFGDQDLKRLCCKTRSIIEQRAGENCGQLDINFSAEALLQLTKDLLKSSEIEAMLLSSSLEDSPKVLFALNELIPVIGNPPDIIQKVRNKAHFFRELERQGIPHPETATAENFEETRKKSENIGFPVVVKPSKGFGGAGVREAYNVQELKQAFRNATLVDNKVLVQERVSGTAASASLISSTDKAVVLTLNEQLLGMREVGQQEPFGYCGNVVPLSLMAAVTDACKSVVEKVVLHFGLVGSNGVDLVISEEGVPYVIEVNPRFQGTLECVERVLRTNIVKAHVEACAQGILPTVLKKPSIFCVRLILFAPQRSITPDLSIFQEASDIPLPGTIVEEGEPVCSIVVEGTSRDSSLMKARKIIESIRKSLQPL